MLTATEFAGFAGAGLAGAAYVPQISHLVRARCSAGISRLAFHACMLAFLLTTARAIAIHAGGSGGTGYSRSARSPSAVRLVAQIATPG
jgi:uncharacterized protein with PQ loop repeat